MAKKATPLRKKPQPQKKSAKDKAKKTPPRTKAPQKAKKSRSASQSAVIKPAKKITALPKAKEPKLKTATPNREAILKKRLILNREEIVREAKAEIGKYIKGETRQIVESVLDDGDWSVIDLSEDINFRRLATHRDVLLKIDEALRKLREGTYGTCEDCGEEINIERLKVLPFAIYCRDCQEKREEIEKIETEEL
ncbi:MAG: TraR/DksA C4-type zinc finger protein [Thermodesulfovibrionales bacterium]|jgi:DnaK suppressor protein